MRERFKITIQQKPTYLTWLIVMAVLVLVVLLAPILP